MARATWIAALAGCMAAGCSDNPELRFEIAFAQSELAERAAMIEARIVQGGCDSETLVYVSTFDPEGEGMRPPPLAPGRYAFQVRAQDRECFWYAQGCSAVTLPAGGRAIEVELESIEVESRDCDAPSCKAAACGPTPDAAAPAAGRGGSGGSDAGAMDAATNPPDDDAGEPPSDAGGTALYRFDVPRSGSYRLWGRVITPTLDEDSFWLRVDDRAWVQWNDIAHSDTWFWVDVRPFEQRLERWIVELDEGEHVIRLSYREIGARIDQLLLTTDVDFVPGSL